MKSQLAVIAIFVFFSGLFASLAQTTVKEPADKESTANLSAPAPTDIIEVVLLADNNYRPYSFVENNTPKGLLIDIVNAVDKELEHYSIVFEQHGWQSAKAKMRNGQQLGLLGTYFNARSWPYAYPYSYPILFEKLVTVCHSELDISKTDATDVSWPGSYKGMKIGTVAGFDGWLSDDVRRRQINTVTFFEFPNAALALLGVQNKVVNCTIFEQAAYLATAEYLVKEQRLSLVNNLQVVNDLQKYLVHIAYSHKALAQGKYPHAADFQKSFDIAFEKLLSSGKLASIYAKYGVEYW